MSTISVQEHSSSLRPESRTGSQMAEQSAPIVQSRRQSLQDTSLAEQFSSLNLSSPERSLLQNTSIGNEPAATDRFENTSEIHTPSILARSKSMISPSNFLNLSVHASPESEHEAVWRPSSSATTSSGSTPPSTASLDTSTPRKKKNRMSMPVPLRFNHKFVARKKAQHSRGKSTSQPELADTSLDTDIINHSIRMPKFEPHVARDTPQSGSSMSELRQLKKELIDCRIQLKLQSEMMREMDLSSGRSRGGDAILLKENKALRAQIDDLLSSFEAAKNQLDKMQKEYGDWQGIVGEILGEQNGTAGSDLKSKLFAARDLVHGLMERTADAEESAVMREKLAAVLAELKEEKKQYDALKRSVEDYKLQEDQQPPKEDTDGIRRQADKLRAENSGLRSESGQWRAENGQLKLENERLRSENMNLKDENGGLMAEQHEDYDDLQKENQGLRAQNDDLSSQLRSSEQNNARLAQLNKRLAAIEAEKRTIEAQKKAAEADKQALEAENSRLTAENARLAAQSPPQSPTGSDSILVTDINFQTHAIKILSRLLDKKSIREAAEKILQLANRAQLKLSEEAVRQLLGAVYEYMLAGMEAIVASRMDVADKAAKQAEEYESRIENLEQQASQQGPSSGNSPRTKLRIDELTRRWKAAEEALSFERWQSKKRLQELEQENRRLKTRAQ